MIHRLHNSENAVVMDSRGISVVIPISEILNFVKADARVTRRRKTQSPSGNMSRNLTLYARAIKTGEWVTGVPFDRDKALGRFVSLLSKSNTDKLILSEAAIDAALDVAKSFEPSYPLIPTLISEIRKAVALQKGTQ